MTESAVSTFTEDLSLKKHCIIALVLHLLIVTVLVAIDYIKLPFPALNKNKNAIVLASAI